MKKALTVIGIILAVILAIILCVYFFVLQYPEIKKDPDIGKWYRVSSDKMKDSEDAITDCGMKYETLHYAPKHDIKEKGI